MKATPCACYVCGKQIKGEAVTTCPPNISIMLGIDFPKSYHPACYAKAEREAEKALFPERV